MCTSGLHNSTHSGLHLSRCFKTAEYQGHISNSAAFTDGTTWYATALMMCASLLIWKWWTEKEALSALVGQRHANLPCKTGIVHTHLQAIHHCRQTVYPIPENMYLRLNLLRTQPKRILRPSGAPYLSCCWPWTWCLGSEYCHKARQLGRCLLWTEARGTYSAYASAMQHECTVMHWGWQVRGFLTILVWQAPYLSKQWSKTKPRKESCVLTRANALPISSEVTSSLSWNFINPSPPCPVM